MFESKQNKRRTIWFTAACALMGGGALLLHAFNPQPDPPKVFGIFGITPADVIRLNVTNVAGAVGAVGTVGTFAPPCRVQMGFVNADGTMLKSADVTIPDGHSATLALNFFEAGAALDVAARTRASVRPVVNLYPPPCFTAVSAEVADAIIGRTNVHATPQLWQPAPALTNSVQ